MRPLRPPRRRALACRHELVEEELVGLGELGAEALVQDVDDLGERDLLVLGLPRADVRRAVQRARLGRPSARSAPR